MNLIDHAISTEGIGRKELKRHLTAQNPINCRIERETVDGK